MNMEDPDGADRMVLDSWTPPDWRADFIFPDLVALVSVNSCSSGGILPWVPTVKRALKKKF